MDVIGRIRVLIVDDQQIFCELLTIALGREADLQVVGAAQTAERALELASAERPNVILLDYHLPDVSGAQLATRLRREGNKAAVVMLTADDSEQALMASVEAGATGFFVKTAQLDQIRSAVRRAADGEMLVPGVQLSALLRKQREQASREAGRTDLLHRLTPRERAILDLSREGFDNRSIARELGISVKTVRGHIQNTLEKLGVHSKLEAVVRGWGRGSGHVTDLLRSCTHTCCRGVWPLPQLPNVV